MSRTARARSPKFQVRSRTRLALAAIAALTASTCSWAVSATPATAASTVVTIGFDDGTAEQLGALPILQAHGMTATFFVNTASIDDLGHEHLTWAELHTLFDAGNEIAGHTLHHANLAPLTTAEARQEVCTDRNNLLTNGFPATSFAYPFGSFDSGTEQVVQDCGYNSGRGVAGISKNGPFAETIPPLDPYATRTPPNPKKATKLSTMESYVLDAEANGGGWVQFVFHRLCEQCGAYAITQAKFTALLDFLQGEVAGGRVVVQTTAQVIGGPVQPPVPA